MPSYLSIATAFLVSVTVLLVLRPAAKSLGLLDKPGGRKTHHGDVPIVGGIAMFAGVVVAVAGAPETVHGAVILVMPAALMVLVGALDDRFDLPPVVRLFAHSTAAVAMVYGIGSGVPHLGDLFGFGRLELGVFSYPFTVVATIALINGFNMLDGLDGLAASAGIAAFSACLALGLWSGSATALLVSGGMVGAILGFSLFNLPLQFNRPLRTFMGDAGSTLIGFVLAGVGLLLMQGKEAYVSPVAFLWAVPVPIFELFTSTGRRLASGKHPMAADANHFHHVMLRSGMSVRAIALIYFLFSGCSAVAAVALVMAGISDSLLLLGFLILYGAWVLSVRFSGRIVRWLPSWARYIPDTTGH